MNNLIVLDHPYTLSSGDNVPHHRSFSAAIAKSVIEKLAARGEAIDIIDLHADHFDPVMSADELTCWRLGRPMNAQVADYQKRMLEADRIILIYPIWWEQMPAMMKGFADKVYAKNILYDQHGLIYKTRLKQDLEVHVFTVHGAPRFFYTTLIHNFVIMIKDWAIAVRSGIKRVRHHAYCNVDKLPEQERFRLLESIKI